MDNVWKSGDGLTVTWYCMPGIDARMYVVQAMGNVIVVDPQIQEGMIRRLRTQGIEHLQIYLTHEHFDHIAGVNRLREMFDCTVTCSKRAAESLTDASKNLAKFWETAFLNKSPEEYAACAGLIDEDYTCEADETFDAPWERDWHGHRLAATLAPGHSPGGILYFLDDVVFTGDNLVNGAGVICRIPGGSWRTYTKETLPQIERLPDATVVFPGHGDPGRLGELRQYLVKFRPMEKINKR